MKNLGVPDRFIEHGVRSELLEMLGLTAQGIASSIRGDFPELFPKGSEQRTMAKNRTGQ